jgi:hypothetical protein
MFLGRSRHQALLAAVMLLLLLVAVAAMLPQQQQQMLAPHVVQQALGKSATVRGSQGHQRAAAVWGFSNC